ncbi:MAG: DUF167 domain-containing protein [Heliobacteriaceae bacterium]|jgi:uncharacterized protein (TIGR00251 family)|nr:DUF167 domain-containing protein [Heliobacteriaceae bacterium]
MMFQEKEDGLVLHIRLTPGARKNEITVAQGVIKVKVTAQPVDNKANKALTEFLSKRFKVPKTSIEIIKGETSREKTLLIKTLCKEKIRFIKDFLDN